MFRFWYRYVFGNRTLLETGAQDTVLKRRIEPNYSEYMGLVFEKVCKQYLYRRNCRGELPILFTTIGRWWGSDPKEHKQVEIDLIANDGNDYIACECKWKNEMLDLSVLNELRRKPIFSVKNEIKHGIISFPRVDLPKLFGMKLQKMKALFWWI
jgi:hypothetical protein